MSDERERIELLIRTCEEFYRRGYPPKGTTGRPSALSMAAAELGIPRTTARDMLKRAEERYGLKPDESLFDDKSHRITELTEEVSRYRGKVSELEAEIGQLRNELDRLRAERDAILGISQLDVGSNPIEISDIEPCEEVAVLFTSDFQWGEVIDPEQVDGYNAYDIEIACRRYDRLVQLAVEKSKSRNAKKLILLRGGDSFSGDIHEELSLTNESGLHSCFKSLAAKEISGIEYLCSEFDHVHVISVPGNHSLANGKTRFKRYVEVNYDDLLSWFLETHFATKEVPNVEFTTPRSGDAVFRIHDRTFVLTHGDRVGARGGTGFLGPVAVCYRGILNVLKQQTAVGVRVDCVLMGHFHVPMIFPKGIVNGTLAGYNEYAKYALRAEPGPPSQWLFFVDRDRGITCYELLVLE